MDYEFDKPLSECPVCNSTNISKLLTDHREIDISECSKCQFQFMNPQYSDKYLDKFYSEYFTDEVNDDSWKEATFYRHNFYLSLVENHCSKGKILDVGCGNGHLLRAAISRGWRTVGYDVDEKTTQAVSRELGIDVQSGDFFSIDYENEEFDVVSMHQVLEHLKQPNEYLTKINSIIKKDGCLFIGIPNIKSLANRFKSFLEKRGLRKRNIGKYYDSDHHVLYFEPQTLIRLLENHGFKVVYQRNGHSSKANQSGLKRFFMRNLTEYFFARSTFFIIAKKL